jgi:hypothetical protein
MQCSAPRPLKDDDRISWFCRSIDAWHYGCLRLAPQRDQRLLAQIVQLVMV